MQRAKQRNGNVVQKLLQSLKRILHDVRMSVCVWFASYPRGYAEKQKVYGILVEGHSMNVFFTPQILGSGEIMGAGRVSYTCVADTFRAGQFVLFLLDKSWVDEGLTESCLSLLFSSTPFK